MLISSATELPKVRQQPTEARAPTPNESESKPVPNIIILPVVA